VNCAPICKGLMGSKSFILNGLPSPVPQAGAPATARNVPVKVASRSILWALSSGKIEQGPTA
jgi:hypothetical protein